MRAYKVKIRHSNARRKEHWWITCPLCHTKTHTRKSKWQNAMIIADRHSKGEQHSHKLLQLLREKSNGS